jgi:hypothetical protein
MDNLVFEESVNAEIDQSEFISKKWIYVNDSNSQNYTSQVVIDSTPLSNAGGYINWSEGYIVMPLLVQLTAETVANLPVVGPAGSVTSKLADHAWAFKAGFWNMINSMTVEFNNQNIIQQTPFLNVFRSFKAHTSFSEDDLKNEGSTIGYYPDTAGSWSFAPTSSSASPLSSGGVGLCNNRQAPVNVALNPIVSVPVAVDIATGVGTATLSRTTQFWGASAYSGVPDNSTGAAAGVLTANGAPNPNPYPWSDYSRNEGFAKRSDWYGYDPVNTNSGQNLINDAATCRAVYRSFKQTQTADGLVCWEVYAKLRLKDLADYFAKCPLLKGSTIRFYINTNQASTTFNVQKGTINAQGAVATFNTLNVVSSTVLGGLTQPLMVASADIGQGCSSLVGGVGAAGNYTLSVSIFRNVDSGKSTGLQSCRLYAPVYKMNPLAEQRYLSLAPTKKIEYNDIFQYQFNGLDQGSPFNILVTNGIQDIQSVLVVPFLAAGATGNVTTFSTLLSPTSTSGATPDPVTLTNFNILVSGVNLFLNNQLYDFEQFNQELKSSNQLNGSLTTGLASGLISEDMFSRGYRYYYGNCARILPSEAGVSRSIQIQGTNSSLKQINLMVFVEFKRSMTIDISTGARIE